MLNLLLLLATTAFFLLSINLYHNSKKNLQTVENAYTTLASISFYGDVDSQGNLVAVSDPLHVGNHLISATTAQFDLKQLLDLDMVTGYDLRPRFAAYISGEEAINSDASYEYVADHTKDYSEDERILSNEYHAVRFQILSDKPVEVYLSEKYTEPGVSTIDTAVAVKLTASARALDLSSDFRFFFYPGDLYVFRTTYLDAVKALNQTEDTDKLILYPGVEYVMHFESPSTFVQDQETGGYRFQQGYVYQTGSVPMDYMPVTPDTNQYSRIIYGLGFYDLGETLLTDREQPFFIQRWDVVQSDPKQRSYWEAVFAATACSGQSYWVTLTGDMESVPAWHAGGMYLHEGRMITQEEYASGAKVCMVSARMAQLQGWKIGDILDMCLYIDKNQKNMAWYGEGDHSIYQPCHGTSQMPDPYYTVEADGFFDKGTYTIVGIFGQREITDMGENPGEVYYQPWNTIYVPTNSVQNKPEESTWLIQPSTLTLNLKNGSISEFKAAVEKMGLTEQKTGQYQLKFSYFDQGYSKIKPGLDEMNRNAKLLLGLSAALLVVTMILMAFLFSRQHKHSAGVLRMLGGSKKQAFAAILTCAAAVVAAGGMVGTVLGGVLTQSVGASILGDAAASAKVALSTGASPVLTILSGIGCMVLFLVLTAICTMTYINKEPRALLPEDKG